MTIRILHAGCGGEDLPEWLLEQIPGGQEVKLDVNDVFKPDIIASIDDLGDIGEFDAVFCCHCLEHLQWFRAMKALEEFHRVLKPGGAAFIEVPNLDGIRPDDTVIYTTPQGLKVTGLDMYYGHREFSFDNHWMQHGCGFVPDTLQNAMTNAGFNAKALVAGCDILGLGVKPDGHAEEAH